MKVILATPGHPGRPWEEQDGHEVVGNMIFIDFGVILEPVYVSFLTSRRSTCQFLSGVLPEPFLYRFLNRIFKSRDSKFEVFAQKVLHKSTFRQNHFCEFRNRVALFFGSLGNQFSRFPVLSKINSKTCGLLVVPNVIFEAPVLLSVRGQTPRAPSPGTLVIYGYINIYIKREMLFFAPSSNKSN